MKKGLRILLISILIVMMSLSGGIIAFAKTEKEEAFTSSLLPEVNFKGDYGFAKKSVTKAEMGLLPKEYYYGIMTGGDYWTFAADRKDYDSFLLQMAIEGLLNRKESVLFLNTNIFSGLQSTTGIGDAIFINYYEDKTKQAYTKKEDLGEAGPAVLIEKFGKFFNGVVLYDYESVKEPIANGSTNLVLAYNIASANFCVPVKKDFYYANIESFKGMKIVADVTNNGLTREQSYEWMLNNLYGKKGETLMMNKHALHSMNFNFTDYKMETAGWSNVQGIDYAFKENVFMFNISPFGYNTSTSDGSERLGEILEELLRGVDGKGEPALMLGWNSPEPQWVDRIAPYGIVVECTTAASNTSFHAAMETWSKTRDQALSEGFKQKRVENTEKNVENGKVYLSFLSNEGDAMKTRTNQNQRSWYKQDKITGTSRVMRAEEENKEVFPISWAMTASQLKTVPALIEYYYTTATDQDHFFGSPTGGAGYINLGLNEKIDEYVSAANKYFNLLDIHGADFWYADADSIEKMAEGIDGLTGVTVDLKVEDKSGGYYEIGKTNKIPALRYAWDHWMWMNRDGKYWYWDGAANQLHVDYIFAELEAIAADKTQPHFMPFYGLEDDALLLIWDQVISDPRWEAGNYQIVDMGNLVFLADKYNKTLPPVTPPAPKVGEVYDKALMNDVTKWTKVNSTIANISGGGIKVNIAAGAGYNMAYRDGVIIPQNTDYIKITMGKIDKVWPLIQMVGDVCGFGPDVTWYQKFAQTSDNITYIPIDRRLISTPGKVYRFLFGAEGAGSAEYKAIEFITKEAYLAEAPKGWQIGDKDVISDDDGRYDVDKDNDGIRDGDELQPISNITLEGDILKWDASRDAGKYIVKIFEGETLKTTRIVSTNQLDIKFLTKDIEYKFEIYVKVPGMPDSKVVSKVMTYGEAKTPPTNPIKPGCGAIVMGPNFFIGGGAVMILLFGAAFISLKKKKQESK